MSTLIQPVQCAGSTEVKQPRASHGSAAWAVLLWWTIATCATCLGITLLATWLALPYSTDTAALMPREVNLLIVAIPFLSVAGLIAGQFVVLRSYMPGVERGRWLRPSTLGWTGASVLIIFVNILWTQEYITGGGLFAMTEVEEIAQRGWEPAAMYALPALFMGLAAGAVGGLIVGLSQRAQMKENVTPLVWVIGNVTGLGLGAAVGLYIYGILTIIMYANGPGGDPYGTLRWVLPSPASLLVVGIVTGAVLARHVRRFPRP